jgi:hypothetical protein
MSTRHAYGEDSVYKDGDRWRGAISLGYNANGKRVRKKVSGRTRAEAVEKLPQAAAAGRWRNDAR